MARLFKQRKPKNYNMKIGWFILGLALMMVGCNNPLKKSVTEELTTEELKSISDKEPSFLDFYENYFETLCYQHILSAKTDQVKYGDITYKELYEYYCQISDDGYISSVYSEAEKEWNDRFGLIEKKFDSIIGYWKNYNADYAPETYVDIEFDHASIDDSELMPYQPSDNRVKLYFRLIPKRDALIKKVWFDLTIKTKDDNSKVVFSEKVLYDERNTLVLSVRTTNENVSDSIDYAVPIVIVNDKALYKDLIKDKLSYDDLIKKYAFEYRIRVVGTEEEDWITENMSSKKVPEIGSYIEMLDWDDEEHSSKDHNIIMLGRIDKHPLKEKQLSISKEKIIREYLDTNYESNLDLFKFKFFEEKTKALNPSCYELMHYLRNCN